MEKAKKNSKYFLSLEKSNQGKKGISSLKVNDKVVTKTEDTLKEDVNFYESLYKSTHDSSLDTDSYLEDSPKETILKNREEYICKGPLMLSSAQRYKTKQISWPRWNICKI